MKYFLLMIGITITVSCNPVFKESKSDALKAGKYQMVVQTDSITIEGWLEMTMAQDSAWVGQVKMDIPRYNHRPLGEVNVDADSVHLEVLNYTFHLQKGDTLSGVLRGENFSQPAYMLHQTDEVSAAVKNAVGYLPLTTNQGEYLQGRFPTPIDAELFYFVAFVNGNWREKQIRKARKTNQGWAVSDLRYDSELYSFSSIGISPEADYLIGHGNTQLPEDDPRYKAGLFKIGLKNKDEADSITHLPASINDLGLVIFPSVHADHTIYFAANQSPENLGGMDIYQAQKTDDGYQVDHIGAPVSSELSDAAPYVDPSGSFMLFYRRTEAGEFPSTDKIFIADRLDSRWSEPQKLGAPVNTPYAFEYGARLSTDLQHLYLTSHRRGDDFIYRIPVKDIPELDQRLN